MRAYRPSDRAEPETPRTTPRGIFWNGWSWTARARRQGKTVYLGCYPTVDLAIAAIERFRQQQPPGGGRAA